MQQRATQQKYNYSQEHIADDNMKHISAHTDLKSEWIKQFAWLPKRSDVNNRFIWLTFYYEYVITMDINGKVPLKSQDWRMVYTREEYILKKLYNE